MPALKLALIISNSLDATSDYIENFLSEASINTIRFNSDAGTSDFSYVYSDDVILFENLSIKINPERVSAVIFRRPHPIKIERELSNEAKFHVASEWSEALEGILSHIPEENWINHPVRNSISSHKAHQITVAKEIGFSVPDTLITNNNKLAKEFFTSHEYCIVAKPLSSGYIERDTGGDSTIYTSEISDLNSDVLEEEFLCPIIFQEKINKTVDVRMTVIDNDIHAVALISKNSNGSQILDIRRNNMNGVKYRPLSVPTDIKDKTLALMSSYSLRFAAIDYCISTDNTWYFLEVNPNGQWAWLDLVGVTNISASFIKSLSAAP